jgi:hypothetical protein
MRDSDKDLLGDMLKLAGSEPVGTQEMRQCVEELTRLYGAKSTNSSLF